MRNFRNLASVLALIGLLAILPSFLYAQSSTTGAVAGTVTDATGAVVKGATLTLTHAATGSVQTATSDSGGRFVFPVVNPGDYSLKAEAKGFRTSVTNGLTVDVNKSVSAEVKLEVGASSEVVEVTASSMTEVQTQDASVGEVLSGTELNRLPVAGRSAAQLIFYQPGVAPDMGSGDTTGGQIAGARSDQITFTIDGGDATSDLEGSNNYNSPNQDSSAVSPVVPIPQDSVEEFRVATNNANSTFGSSSGGQVSILTKSGTNTIHGTAYEYHADNGLNANGWTNDFAGIPKPPLVDNRFGAAVGGAIIKDKLFYYAFYEGRRFHDQTTLDKVVPSAQLRTGVIETPDGLTFNFNPALGPLASTCGSAGTSPCDPRGLGISPVVAAQMALLPGGAPGPGYNPSEGDGVNTVGFDTSIATPISTEVSKLKFNYNYNSKWSALVSWQYSSTSRTGSEQVSLLGKPSSVSGDPYFANFFTFQIQGQISPNFLSVTHGSFLKNWWGWTRAVPAPLVPGTDAALQIAGEDQGLAGDFGPSGGKLFTDPININTQQARPRVWDGHDWFIAQDFTKIHGSHQFQFGGAGRIWHDYHKRTDQVLGGLTDAPIYYVGSLEQNQNSYVSISGNYEPVTDQGDALWNGYYASILGLVDHSAQVTTRNGSFIANPIGTPTIAHVTIPTFTSYFQDVWKVRRNLTATIGLNWGVNLAPSEEHGLESVLSYESATPINVQQFLKTRAAMLESGNTYDPTFSIMPVNSFGSPYNGEMRPSIWKDVGPRFAVAWEVRPGLVVRGGYQLVFDRSSAVTSVLSGLLAGGLADISTCAGPTFVGAAGGTAVCTGTSTDPTSAFRIGPDGASVPVPPGTNNPIPLIPSGDSLTRSYGADFFVTPGHSHNIDFTVQKALHDKYFLEVGYIGHFGRNLSNTQQLNAPDYRQKDATSGQTYAQAFDAVNQASLNGTTAPAQPFFENQFAGGTAGCMTNFGTNCTSFVQSWIPAVGTGNIGVLDAFILNGGVSVFTVPTSNNQILENAQGTDGGWSDYNAMIVTLRKAMSHGLQFQANYTWSHAIGIQGTNQQYIYSSESPYNLNVDKSSEGFDHRQTLTAFWYYELPFGKGKPYSTGNNIGDRIIGGWNLSGIFNFFTGSPVCVGAIGNYGSFFEEDCAIAPHGFPSFSRHNGVTGTTWGSSGTINAFADPDAVGNSLQYPLLSVNSQIPHDQLKSFPYWNVDFSIGKRIPITERVGFVLTGDAFNIFNHVVLNTPNLDLGNPSAFGVLASQFAPGISLTGARTLQLGARIEF